MAQSYSRDDGEKTAGSTKTTAGFLLVLVLGTSAACLGPPSIDPGLPRERPQCDPVVENGSVTIDCLGLSFRLPPSFEAAEDRELVFLARSTAPPATFSIQGDIPTVIEHEPEGQESVSSIEIDGVDAVVVTDAQLEGLPAGLAARELLVANGDRSFTVILSAPESELPSLWKAFMESLEIGKG